MCEALLILLVVFCCYRRQNGGGGSCGRLCQGCGHKRYHLYICWGCCILAVTAVITLIITIVIIFNQDQIPPRKLNTYSLAPADTYIFSYSSTYCQGLDSSYEAQIYLLKHHPPLSGPVNNLTAIPNSTVAADSYHYFKFHLYAGSKLAMKYCLNEPSPAPAVSFFLIKGSHDWSRWKDHKNSSSHSKISLVINNPCSGGSRIIPYNFNSTDYYYFAFENPNQETASQIEVSLVLQRTEYIIMDNNTYCCADTVPYRSHYIALLLVQYDELYTSNYNIGVTCYPRVWVYLLIGLIPFFFLVITVFAIGVLCDYVRRRRTGYTTLAPAQPSVNRRDPSAAAPVQNYGGAFMSPQPANNIQYWRT